MVFWRQTLPNTSQPHAEKTRELPRVPRTVNQSQPSLTDSLNEGHSRFCHPASALQSTSKHFVGVRLPFFFQKVSASPGTGKTKNLTRSRQEQRRCFSSSAVRASGTRLDGSWKILGCAFHHEGARERCRRRSSGEAAGRVMASSPSPSLSSIIPADFTPSQKRKQTVSLCRAMSAAAALR